MKRILVTGAGALLGQGILRCIDAAQEKYKVISADPDVLSSGHALADRAYKIPLATDPSYLERIEEIISVEKIDLVFVGTDVELPIFAEQKRYLETKYSLQVVVSNPSVIKIANNKWLTAEFLRKNHFPFPFSALTVDRERINYLKNNFPYPFIAKPVDGARSKGLKRIESDKELEEICNYENNLVVQELISDQEGEFTTGCLVIKGKCVAVVSITRELRDGNTWRAFRQGRSKYDDKIATLAESLGVEGPVNFQYRIKNGEPVVFEINCRFSGTTPLRMMFGFNEVEAVIKNYLYEVPVEKPNLKDGTILRTFSDILVSNRDIKKFEEKGTTSSYSVQYFPFKKIE